MKTKYSRKEQINGKEHRVCLLCSKKNTLARTLGLHTTSVMCYTKWKVSFNGSAGYSQAGHLRFNAMVRLETVEN